MANKKRLIDANAYAYPGDLINEPTIDAVEVVHARWEHDSVGFSDFWRCSACGNDFFFDDDPTVKHARVNYCPNCGAKMDGGNEDA